MVTRSGVANSRQRARRPGSGRSTQIAGIVALLNATSLNATDVMNAAVSVGSPVGEKVSKVLSQNKAVTHQLYAELLKEAMGGSSGPFVIDGWPEDGPGVEELADAGVELTVAIALDVPSSVRSTRITNRSEVSGWDYFSQEERDMSDKNLASSCKAYDTRWGTLSSGLGARGILRVVSTDCSSAQAADTISATRWRGDSRMDACTDHANGGERARRARARAAQLNALQLSRF